MPNKIYIEYYSYEEENSYVDQSEKDTLTQSQILSNANVLELPLLEDVKIDGQSQFTSFNEMVPKIGEIIDLITSRFSAATGEVGAELLELKNKFDLPKWQKTDPIKINVTLGFFTKTDSWSDVYKPTKDIIGLSILSKDPSDNTNYIVPGISLNTQKEYNIKNKGNNKNPSVNEIKAKIVALEIPGIIYIPLAYVEMALPTYSKQQTESGYPLWCTLDCQFVSVSPATTEMYNNAILGRTYMQAENYEIAKQSSKVLG